jgi:sugar lactone lactonase YvrE
MSIARCVVDAKAALGETPVWSAAENRLYWIDCIAGAIHRYDPVVAGDTLMQIEVEGYLGAISLRAQGGLLVLAGKALWTLDAGSTTPRRLAEVEQDMPDNLVNDGKCDPAGRFWFGTMHAAESEATGALYRFDGAEVVKVDQGFICANGMGWSPDGNTFYLVDMMPGNVLAYDYNPATGTVRNRRTLFSIPDSEGMPDGLCVDSEGGIWVAHWDGWRISRWSPEGSRLQTLEVPVQRPTCPVFGGPDLATLYLTSSAADLPTESLARGPLSGALFAIDAGVPGVPIAEFAG